MPLEIIKRKIPSAAKLAKMSRDEHVTAELKIAAEIGVHHKGNMPMGVNFRSSRTTSREATLIGLKKPSDQVMRRNDDDVQPGSLSIGDPSIIAKLPQFAPDLLEKQVLAHVERMGARTFATVAKQVLPQLNALAVLGKQSRRIKAVQTALAKRAYSDKALAAMKRKKSGGIKG